MSRMYDRCTEPRSVAMEFPSVGVLWSTRLRVIQEPPLCSAVRIQLRRAVGGAADYNSRAATPESKKGSPTFNFPFKAAGFKSGERAYARF